MVDKSSADENKSEYPPQTIQNTSINLLVSPSEINNKDNISIKNQENTKKSVTDSKPHIIPLASSSVNNNTDTIKALHKNTTPDKSDAQQKNILLVSPSENILFDTTRLYDDAPIVNKEARIHQITHTLQTESFEPTELNVNEEDISLPLTTLQLDNNDQILTLVDTGASITLIADQAAKDLGLKVAQEIKLTVNGYKGKSRSSSNIYEIIIKGGTLEYKTFVAGVPDLPEIRYKTPVFSEEDHKELELYGLTNRDVIPCEEFDRKRIGMILGNDILPHFIRGSQRICLPSGRYIELSPFAKMTFPRARHCPVMDTPTKDNKAVVQKERKEHSINTLMAQKYGRAGEDDLTDLILQLWKSENCGVESATLREEEYLDQRRLLLWFEDTLEITEGGQIAVALPWNGKEIRMGTNKNLAYKRLMCLIEKLRNNSNLLREYNKIIKEQLKAGIIERVTPEMQKQGKSYYAPQNAVFKANSANTKVRIVGDSSSHQKGQLSLNDCLFEGPNMLRTAPGLHLRHRIDQYPIVGDIARAFHQVRLQEKDRNVTKWLWVEDIEKPPTGDNLVEYRFTRIPFGMKCSPFLLAATIRHYLLMAASILSIEIDKNLYVDNIMVSTNYAEEVLPKIKGIQEEFRVMSMPVREFGTNYHPALLEIPEADRAESHISKFLGYSWNTTDDTITVLIPEPSVNRPTKRDIASFFAKTFDPMGYSAPLHVKIKKFVQKIWQNGLEWKAPLTDKLNKEWEIIKQQYKDTALVIPRKLRQKYHPNEKPEIVVFCDASQHTYACAVYIVYRHPDGSVESNLIGAKSKVRPSSGAGWTIPRLELLAMEIGMRYTESLIHELPEKDKPVSLDIFSDSMIALYWILTEEQKKQWVNNRVTTVHEVDKAIKESGMEVSYHHVTTDKNPADLATRGIDSTSLQNCTFWLNGPSFLSEPRKNWETKLEGEIQCPIEDKDEVNLEMRNTSKPKNTSIRQKKRAEAMANLVLVETSVNATVSTSKKPKQTTEIYTSFVPFEYTNSLSSLTRITNMVLKFISTVSKNKILQSEPLKEYTECNKTTDTVERETRQRKLARLTVFTEHYKEAESRDWKFKETLNPFQSKDGLWRTKKHYQSPNIPLETSEPILVHREHKLAVMLMDEIHKENVHLPANYLVTALRSKYWIQTDGRLARSTISRCVACRKVKSFPFLYPYNTSLKENRTVPSTPFAKVGLDFFGPLQYKNKNETELEKGYVLIYTCLTTRCTHLEICADSSTTSYLNALKAIFAQRGVPKYIYSDNAQTFQLGERVLREDIKSYEPESRLINFLAREDINFRHITPMAPWQGGVYERIVGIAKKQFRKEIGKQIFSFPELHSIMKRVEGAINSRPLIRNPVHVNDVPVLRPIDFLLPAVLLEVPNDTDNLKGDILYDPTVSTTEKETREHLKKMDRVMEKLWKIWSTSYLLLLRENAKRNNRFSKVSPRVGQVVLIQEEMIPRHTWPVGRITKLIGTPPLVQSVEVLYKGSIKERAVNQLIPLEIDEEQETIQTPEHATTSRIPHKVNQNESRTDNSDHKITSTRLQPPRRAKEGVHYSLDSDSE
ncbi:hypothetical protein GCK72_017397 [Caenorhabditis remanei]|uniref:Integrase catalytic domain-containing protein n=1 Tax=Caenorhabditis remanei TaxID=31234 RepID=A0A6A5G7M5_CAERE|nr:hypothetical protein GCK72_017397 [Caenorhabditis remanei]KAF1750846.1 hypothetical protein GCK72_017397 [Caenorhabditis remanei]